MQTSNLTPITLYHSQHEEAELLIPLLPEGSKSVEMLADIPRNRRAIMVTHDSSTAHEATQWIAKQSQHRQSQLFLLLPRGDSRLNPACRYAHQPIQLTQILDFLRISHTLPELPEQMKLTEIETKLLEQLYSADTPIDHSQLLEKIWGYKAEMETHTLETHLYRLRKKLEATHWNIVTEEGRYRLLSSADEEL